MNTLRYKDFQGTVEFIDGFLLIQILHIDDVITTQVDNASGAQAAFEELVNEYLLNCEEDGTAPCKPFKGSFNVRVTPELHRHVAMAAAEDRMSMNAWVQVALEAKIARRNATEHFALLDVYVQEITQARSPIHYSASTRPGRPRTAHRSQSFSIPGWPANTPRRDAY